MAQQDHHPMIAGRRIKLKYAHAGGYNPPLIVIHGNQVSHTRIVQALLNELLP